MQREDLTNSAVPKVTLGTAELALLYKCGSSIEAVQCSDVKIPGGTREYYFLVSLVEYYTQQAILGNGRGNTRISPP